VIDVDEAARLAETKLAEPLPRRWRHVRSVARRARWLAKQLALAEELEVAAWLHDIGYAPDLVVSGFHPLDGARFLRRTGLDERVVSLVAHHSYARIEAEVRGLGAELALEFDPADQPGAPITVRAGSSNAATASSRSAWLAPSCSTWPRIRSMPSRATSQALPPGR
jgi:putative nucleotidyltransferase with HDIG domain